jgi:hypothetical protein
MRDKDVEDITSERVLARLDWNLLEQAKDEMRLSTLSEESLTYKFFLKDYEDYVKENKLCAN